jgi:hypothetical protein
MRVACDRLLPLRTVLVPARRFGAAAFRDRLPRSSVGKVLIREPRAAYWLDAGRHV